MMARVSIGEIPTLATTAPRGDFGARVVMEARRDKKTDLLRFIVPGLHLRGKTKDLTCAIERFAGGAAGIGFPMTSESSIFRFSAWPFEPLLVVDRLEEPDADVYPAVGISLLPWWEWRQHALAGEYDAFARSSRPGVNSTAPVEFM